MTARADIPGVEEWAAAVSYSPGPYEGSRVPFPDMPERPTNTHTPLRSAHMPVAVHAGRGVDAQRARAALNALELAYGLAEATSWPLPAPDGGRGGTAGFDLYLLDDADIPATAAADVRVSWTGLDSATSFGIVAASVDPVRLEACVAQAFSEAALLGQDPAEAAGWRRSTATYFAWLVTGRFGCGNAVERQLRHPHRAWMGSQPLGGGALFLAMLAEREDGGSGDFIRELWQFTRQHSAADEALRKTPRLWQALDRALENAGQATTRLVQDFAVARYFVGDPSQRRHTSLQSPTAVDAITPTATRSSAALPWHPDPVEPPLQVFGSHYTRIDVEPAHAGRRLRLWLRGEHGVQWSMVAVRLAADGSERGRVVASGGDAPRRYLPIVLTEDTDAVLVVVTNLGDELPDARHPEHDARAFRLIANLD